MHHAIRAADARALDGVKKKERKQLAKILAKIDANLAEPLKPRSPKKAAGGRKKKKAGDDAA